MADPEKSLSVELARWLGDGSPRGAMDSGVDALEIVAEADAAAALRRFARAVESGKAVALLDPWAADSRNTVMRALLDKPVARSRGAVWLATGGTTGGIRFCRHGSWSLGVAARGFAAAFPEIREHWSALPPHHAGGLMPFLRAAASGGVGRAVDYRDWLAGRISPKPGPGACLSLVPTQLGRLLRVPGMDALLRTFTMIFIGGAALPDPLRVEAIRRRLPLAPCYGMTETAAMVTVLRPADFLGGVEGCGGALPHVRVETAEPDDRVTIETDALFEGYLDAGGHRPRGTGAWPTQDAAAWSGEGSLVVRHRLDRVINSGGEKLSPEWVERVVAGFPGIHDVFVFGEPDGDWGERVIAAVEATDGGKEPLWRQRAREALSPAERPKAWIVFARLPRTAMGKVDGRVVRETLRKSFPSRSN